MSILHDFASFRRKFSVVIENTIAVSFVNGSPATITRASGDFVTDGYWKDMTITATGSASNDGVRLLAHGSTVPTNLVLTLDPAETVTPEGPVSVLLTGRWLDADGYEAWPGSQTDRHDDKLANLMRSGGFDGGFTGVPALYTGAAFNVSVNALAADSTPGTDEYDWYLSQRTDVTSRQLLDIDEYYVGDTNTYSGSVTIVHNALATTELGSLTAPSVDQVLQLFNRCHLYCRRRSDGAIQWIDLGKAMP